MSHRVNQEEDSFDNQTQKDFVQSTRHDLNLIKDLKMQNRKSNITNIVKNIK